MPDDAVSVARLFVESVTHRIHVVVESKQTAVHQAGGLRFENLRAAELSVLQVSNHELRHIGSTAAQTTGRKRIDDLKRLRIARAETITIRHERREVSWEWLRERRMCHVERLENILSHVLVERTAR